MNLPTKKFGLSRSVDGALLVFGLMGWRNHNPLPKYLVVSFAITILLKQIQDFFPWRRAVI
jgi:hypothetical protein